MHLFDSVVVFNDIGQNNESCKVHQLNCRVNGVIMSVSHGGVQQKYVQTFKQTQKSTTPTPSRSYGSKKQILRRTNKQSPQTTTSTH